MAVIKSDSFTYSDGGLTAAGWTVVDTGFNVSSGTVVPSNPALDHLQTWTGDTWPDDQYGQVAVSGGAAGDGDQTGMGIALRVADIDNLYRVVVNGRATNNVTVAKYTTAGGYSLITQRTQAFSDGDTLLVEVVGDTLRVYHNGTQIGADIAGDAALASGDVGIAYSGSAAGMSLDNFEGGSLATAQLLSPSADSVDGSWTDNGGGTALAAAIDETTASDTDYIRSPLGPSNSACRVKLATGSDPASSSGHIVHWRTGKDLTGGATIGVTVKLYQGGGDSLGAGTLIASFTRANVDALTTYDETLSGGEADSITNYGDLYLEFSANQT